ncbi:MAG: hypothetical protein HY892_10920 [Deltaproteobacteria bacterium]|nr:hypothetical protein [Deltaproteobacteria bacterium]
MISLSVSRTLTVESIILPLSLVFFSVMDVWFTLICIQQGGSELNPFMALALNAGVETFVSVKLLLTVIPAAILSALSRHRWAAAGLYLVNCIYLGIIYFHLTHLI